MDDPKYKFHNRSDLQRFRQQIRSGGIVRSRLRDIGKGLYVRGESPVGFEIDHRQLAETMGYLLGLAEIGIKELIGGLNHAAARWLREIQRHMPVDVGLARESFNMSPAHRGQNGNFEAQVGTNVPYVFYLEFGTKYIAGGQVKAWRPGQSPVIMWPAKEDDLPRPGRSKPGSKARARKEAILAKALDPSTTEFMPPMRGSWQLIRGEITADLRIRLALALKKRAGN